jgi:hypothetical protein
MDEGKSRTVTGVQGAYIEAATRYGLRWTWSWD